MDAVIVATGPNLGQVFQLAGDQPIVIGRHSPAIKLLDSHVSRSHAQLVPCQGAWRLEDLKSSNGTFLNGSPLQAPATLAPGDRIQVGQTLMVFTQLAATADSDQIALNAPAISPPAEASAAGAAASSSQPSGPVEQDEESLDDADLGELIGSSDKAPPSEDFADLLLDDAAPSEGSLSEDVAGHADQAAADEPDELDHGTLIGSEDSLDLPAGVEIEPDAAPQPAIDPDSLDDDTLSGSGLDLVEAIDIELVDPEPDSQGPPVSGRPESPVGNWAGLDQDESDEPEILSDLLSPNPSAGSVNPDDEDDDGDDDDDDDDLPLNLDDDDDFRE